MDLYIPNSKVASNWLSWKKSNELALLPAGDEWAHLMSACKIVPVDCL